MRFSLSVVNGATGVRRDVLVDADPETEVVELLPRLLDATDGEMHPGFAKQVPVWVDGQPVEKDHSLRAAHVQPGSVVALHEPDGYDAALPRGVVEMRVVSGPGAGRIHRFGIGEHQIGNGASGMSLPDLFLPTDALVIRVTADAEVEIVERNRAVLLDGRDPSEPDPEHDEEDAAAVELLPMEALTRRERKRRKKQQRRDRKARAQGREAGGARPAQGRPGRGGAGGGVRRRQPGRRAPTCGSASRCCSGTGSGCPTPTPGPATRCSASTSTARRDCCGPSARRRSCCRASRSSRGDRRSRGRSCSRR